MKRLSAVMEEGRADAQMRLSKELDHKARKAMQLMDNKDREGRELLGMAEAHQAAHDEMVRRVSSKGVSNSFAITFEIFVGEFLVFMFVFRTVGVFFTRILNALAICSKLLLGIV